MSGRDPGLALVRALAAAGPPFELLEATSRDWFSATFTGARHVIRLELAESAAAAAWLAGLPEAEFTLRGHFVADLRARRDGDTVTIEALTIEAA